MSPSPPSQTGSDAVLAEVVEEFTNRLQAGESVDVESYVRKHPDHAERLRQLLPALALLDDLGRSVSAVDGSALAESRESSLAGVLGDFRIVREVGKGGMGIVYEAEQISLRRRVALKVLPLAAMMDPRHLQRFHNEARAAACLDHPHIVKVYAVGCERGVHYFAMKFIDGRSLAELIAVQRHDSASERRQLPDSSPQGADAPRSPGAVTQPIATAATQSAPRDAAHYRRVTEWGIQAAEALEHAHSLGIVHRDIKPGNLMIDGVGELWVTDFGLARTGTDASLTMSGDVLGTLRYMSPEQALAKHSLVDHRTDLYALGATLYELLTLRPAVDGIDRQEILRKIAFEEPTPPRSYDRTIPADLESIVLKALAKEPADRYSTAQELADELQRYLQGRPLQRTRPVRWWERFWRWCRRNPSLALVSGLAIAALLAATVVSLLFALRESHNAKTLGQALAASEANRRQAERRLAENYLDQGLNLCEQGEIGVGLHWLVRALQTVPEDQADLQGAIRANLAGWARRLHALESILEHEGPVLAVVYTPDGRTVLTGSEDGMVRFWDAATGERLDRVLALPGGVRNLALSPDGQTLVTMSGEPGQRLTLAGGEGGYTDPINRAKAGGIIRFWETATGKPLGPPLVEWGRPFAVAFSPDGQTLATGDRDRSVRLRHVRSGQLRCPPLPHPDEVWAIGFSPDGRRVATGCWQPGVRLWEMATGRPSSPALLPVSPSFAVAWSPDGQRIVTGNSDNTARIWDAVSGKDSGSLLQHRGLVSAAAFSPDGRTILTGSYDKTARLWDATKGKSVGQPLLHQGFIQAVAFSPDGKSFVTSSWDGTARLWRRGATETRSVPILHEGSVSAASFSADGRALLTAHSDKTVRLWDATTDKLLWKTPPLARGAQTLAVSPTGQLAAAAGIHTGVIRVWEVASGKQVCRFYHPRLQTLAFSSDGRFLLTGGDKARLWDVRAGKPIDWKLPHPERVEAVAFSRDGRLLLTGGSDRAVRLWDAATGRPLGEALSHAGSVKAIALSPDDRTIFSATNNGLIYRWDRDTGAPLGHPLQTQDTRVGAPRFSPDGRIVLLVFGDGVVRLRDVATGRRIGPPLRHFGGIEAIAFGPDGRSLLTLDRDNRTALLWEVPAPLTIERDHVTCWIEAITGLEADPDGTMHVLDAPRWRQRQHRLSEMGGSP